MRIFEEGGPLDPTVEEPQPSAAPAEEVRSWQAPEPARGRSLGVLALFAANLALAALAVLAIWWLFGARRYLLNDSAEFGSEMDDAKLGLQVMTIAGWVLVGGFALSALGVLTLTRFGYRVQVLWALLLCFTIVGLPYGIAVILFLRRPGTHARFFV